MGGDTLRQHCQQKQQQCNNIGLPVVGVISVVDAFVVAANNSVASAIFSAAGNQQETKYNNYYSHENTIPHGLACALKDTAVIISHG